MCMLQNTRAKALCMHDYLVSILFTRMYVITSRHGPNARRLLLLVV